MTIETANGKRIRICECTDAGCTCKGACLSKPATTLRRIDMQDALGVRFCEPCADDAMASGVFAVRERGAQ